MTPKIPMQDDEIAMHKPVCADFTSFRAGIRCAERVYGVAELIESRDTYQREDAIWMNAKRLALESVVRDAARYRWLLDCGKPNLWVQCGGMNAYDDVEAAIDAVMKETK